MQSITELTVFFASLMAVAVVLATVLVGVAAGRLVSQRQAARAVVAQPAARRLSYRPRRIAHQH